MLSTQNRIRTIGVCFGHQIVARALGVEVGRNGNGWEVAVDEVDLSAQGRKLFGKDILVSTISYPSVVLSPAL